MCACRRVEPHENVTSLYSNHLSMVHFWLGRKFSRGQAVLGCIKVLPNQKRRDDTIRTEHYSHFKYSRVSKVAWCQLRLRDRKWCVLRGNRYFKTRRTLQHITTGTARDDKSRDCLGATAILTLGNGGRQPSLQRSQLVATKSTGVKGVRNSELSCGRKQQTKLPGKQFLFR